MLDIHLGANVLAVDVVATGTPTTFIGGTVHAFQMNAGATATLSGVTFANGLAPDITNHGNLTIANCSITGNNVGGLGGGIINYGFAEITNSNIIGNYTSNNGGGIENLGGASMILTNSLVRGNSAVGEGGGLYNQGLLTVANTTFSGNRHSIAGAVSDETSSISYFYQCAIFNNTATSASQRSRTTIPREPLSIALSRPTAPRLTAPFFSFNASPSIVNCILWNDAAPSALEIVTAGGSPTVQNSDIDQSGYAESNNNIDADPLFIPGSPLQLLTGSQAIDKGNNGAANYAISHTGVGANDLAGNPRFYNGTVDMGAYEYQGGVSLIFKTPPPAQVVIATTIPTMEVDVEQGGAITHLYDGTYVTLSELSGPAGAVGALPGQVINGVALFPGVSATAFGAYQLTAADGPALAPPPASFNVVGNGSAPYLVFTTQPTNVNAGNEMNPVVVSVEEDGYVLNTDSSTVYAIVNTYEYRTQAVNGVATFAGNSAITIPSNTTPGTYTLLAIDPDSGATAPPRPVSPYSPRQTPIHCNLSRRRRTRLMGVPFLTSPWKSSRTDRRTPQTTRP